MIKVTVHGHDRRKLAEYPAGQWLKVCKEDSQ